MSIVICNTVGGVGIDQAATVLAQGGSAIDAMEQGIRLVESDPAIHSVGYGGWPNLLGEVELDACVMEGRRLRAGAVGAVQGYLHPISIARKVMERLPHVLLVGSGAARFAAECGLASGDNLTSEAYTVWDNWRKQYVTSEAQELWTDLPLAPLTQEATDSSHIHGTTVFIAQESSGHMAVGVSTSGWAFKYPGRLGDSSIVGAGCYVDDRYGAAACVGQGELAIRAGTARAVVLYLKMGLSLRDACHEALHDLDPMRDDLRSFVTIHAMSSRGEQYVVAWGHIDEPTYWTWHDGLAAPELRPADRVVL